MKRYCFSSVSLTPSTYESRDNPRSDRWSNCSTAASTFVLTRRYAEYFWALVETRRLSQLVVSVTVPFSLDGARVCHSSWNIAGRQQRIPPVRWADLWPSRKISNFFQMRPLNVYGTLSTSRIYQTSVVSSCLHGSLCSPHRLRAPFWLPLPPAVTWTFDVWLPCRVESLLYLVILFESLTFFVEVLGMFFNNFCDVI